MELQEFFELFMPNYNVAKQEFEENNCMDEFEGFLIESFPDVLQNFTDKICAKQREIIVDEIESEDYIQVYEGELGDSDNAYYAWVVKDTDFILYARKPLIEDLI